MSAPAKLMNKKQISLIMAYNEKLAAALYILHQNIFAKNLLTSKGI